MTNLGSRLKWARDYRGLTQDQLAELASTKEMPISQAAISALEKRNSETTIFLFALARALRINPEWLQTGQGANGLDEEWIPLDELTPDEVRLIQAYRKQPSNWKLLVRLLLERAHDNPAICDKLNELLAQCDEPKNDPPLNVGQLARREGRIFIRQEPPARERPVKRRIKG